MAETDQQQIKEEKEQNTTIAAKPSTVRALEGLKAHPKESIEEVILMLVKKERALKSA